MRRRVVCEHMVTIRQFQPVVGRRLWRRAPAGPAADRRCGERARGFDLSSIASLGSAIALVVFALVTAGHLRVRRETGASACVLAFGLASTTVVPATFVFTTLVDQPASAVTLVVVLALSTTADLVWKRRRNRGGAGGATDVVSHAPPQPEEPS
jgi:hypothetical protein